MILLREVLLLEGMSPAIKKEIAQAALLVNRSVITSDAFKQARIPAFKAVLGQVSKLTDLGALKFKDVNAFKESAKFYFFYLTLLLRFQPLAIAFKIIQEKLTLELEAAKAQEAKPEEEPKEQKPEEPIKTPPENAAKPEEKKPESPKLVSQLLGDEAIPLKQQLFKIFQGTEPSMGNQERKLKELASKIQIDSTFTAISDSVYKSVVEQIFRMDVTMFANFASGFGAFSSRLENIKKQLISAKPEQAAWLFGLEEQTPSQGA